MLLIAGKAQIVEAELLSSHREETIQLQKAIAQKEDELNRAVQKYEQVIQVLNIRSRSAPTSIDHIHQVEAIKKMICTPHKLSRHLHRIPCVFI